jgi:hypothetical protein
MPERGFPRWRDSFMGGNARQTNKLSELVMNLTDPGVSADEARARIKPMTSRVLLLSCLAVAACLPGAIAWAQQEEDAGTCGLWGLEAPGEEERGVRLGARLGEIKPLGGWPSDEVRLYDRLEHQLLRYDAALGGVTVQTIRCDAGEPLVVGRGVGGAKNTTSVSNAGATARAAACRARPARWSARQRGPTCSGCGRSRRSGR